MDEPDLVRERYARRRGTGKEALYDIVDPWVLLAVQEKERALASWIRSCGLQPVAERRLLEVGCGTGDDLLQFLRLGFAPANLVGCELLEGRAAVARTRLPDATTVICGDAAEVGLADESFDVVSHSTVFTSLLDGGFQQTLADRMWSLVRPGGGILWYDFVFDNPRNADVKGVPIRRVRELFPGDISRSWKLTLLPPLARPLARVHPFAYLLVNRLAPLRISRLCWIHKPR